MKLNLEELKKLADAKPDNIIEALKVDGLTMIEAWKQLPLLISRIEELEKALEHTKKFCLCERNTFGFDYGEVHPLSGKPGAGKRWLTPQVVATKALEGAKE